MKRSTDGGQTWSALRVLHDDGAHSLNNPTVVQERASGRIFLWYQRIPVAPQGTQPRTRATGLDGPDIYRNFILTSDDDGVTWSAPLDVTAQRSAPSAPRRSPAAPASASSSRAARTRAGSSSRSTKARTAAGKTTPSSATMPARRGPIGDDVPGAFVPDGKGGERSQINEVQMAELSDGSVLLDSRQFGGANACARPP